jgi:hypothetical protein
MRRRGSVYISSQNRKDMVRFAKLHRYFLWTQPHLIRLVQSNEAVG